MPRRQFLADLEQAQQSPLPPNVCHVHAGEDDGQFTFNFSAPAANGKVPVDITAIVPELSDYPKSHEYMIFAADSAPPIVGAAIQKLAGTGQKTVSQLIELVAAKLSSIHQDADGDTHMSDSQNDGDALEYDEDEDSVYGSDHEAFEPSSNQQAPAFGRPHGGAHVPRADSAFRARIRSDLIAAKHAGFKVGHLGHLLDGFNAFVTLSVRMSKLGISEEAMQAWQVEPSDYLILIIQYPNGYKSNEELHDLASFHSSSQLGVRVCAGRTYKPTLQDAIKAFAVAKKTERASIDLSELPRAEDITDSNGVRETFISKPLVALMQKRLIPILRYRHLGMDWAGAEAWYDALEIAAGTNSDGNIIPDKYFEPEIPNPALPKIVTADHFAETSGFQHSFPLLAMQFLVRHFVRCTEFCLVCHRKLNTEVEAIKPYICEQPLCLYQYMTLGFGPSIEHEIMAQPYVVDLLISFCYNSAAAVKLKDYPDGLALVLPPLSAPESGHYQVSTVQTPKPQEQPDEKMFECGYDHDRLEIIFHERPPKCPVNRGSWIVLKAEAIFEDAELHCRVSETVFFPTITIDPPIILRPKNADEAWSTTAGVKTDTLATQEKRPLTPAATPKYVAASFQIYGRDFEQMDPNEKSAAICKLLDTLPSVKEMQKYLCRNNAPELKHWQERISPSALSLLRWIIASNRACIMQVDGGVDSKDESKGAAINTIFGKPQERLSGMKDYMQFRFAMGAPDKEQRFLREVRKTTKRLNLTYPTIFAWHGSPLHNWHMIIREGLHYKNVVHGRAHGDGVYHAKEAQVSTGYAGRFTGFSGSGGGRSHWPNSVLRIDAALALNEIVNAPTEFKSSYPYYVVQQLDWIQTRYLLVSCRPTSDEMKKRFASDERPKFAHQQDPTRIPQGVSGSIAIPASAIKSGKGVKHDRQPPFDPTPFKKHKRSSGVGDFSNPIIVDDDDEDDISSVATEPEDLEILSAYKQPSKSNVPHSSQSLPPMKKPKPVQTDFVPGKLDYSTLPLMPQPSFAVPSTSKRLMTELHNLHKIQKSSDLAELGWSMDVDKIENPYQWIVELHSFHNIKKDLPLVRDMREKNFKSIVLEIRFNKDYPFTPPYVRVIRPRFLSFAHGGGGHIVAGGAMCMELLTNSGWSSVSTMESVLMQIRLAIASDPPARVAPYSQGDYGTREAADGYIRACQTHGWAIPPGFREMAYGLSTDKTS